MIRKARKEEAAQITELFMLALPTNSFMDVLGAYLDDKDFFGHTMKHMVRNLK
jgi:hypothetical protein